MLAHFHRRIGATAAYAAGTIHIFSEPWSEAFFRRFLRRATAEGVDEGPEAPDNPDLPEAAEPSEKPFGEPEAADPSEQA
ncbi:MAG TPA: hypothetical protein PKE04_13520, partial [Clostridia bacterium]|nr:hypothetical protein [Clostridia bacterium]